MGLDIIACTDKDIIPPADIRYHLSRIFLQLVLRQHDNDDDEINQISEISGIDLLPVLEMRIPDTSYLEFQLDATEDEQEIKRIQEEVIQTKEQFSKDIDAVIDSLEKLDKALKEMPDYYKQLRLTNANKIRLNYFKNYSVDVKPNKYGFVSDADTNFGVDIRMLLNYLIFARSQGATKTYFTFG